MCHTTFAFGQRGGYHFECPSQWRHARLPPAVQALFSNEQVSHVYDLSLGHDDVFFVAFHGKDGLDHVNSSGLPEGLIKFLFEKDAAGMLVRDIPKLRVSLGPYNGSYFATDGTHTRWFNVPAQLEAALESNMTSDRSWTDAPRLVELGGNDNYVMITVQNAGSWQLSNYLELRTILRGFRDNGTSFSVLENVFLNPHRFENWVLQGTNGSVLGDGFVSFMQDAFDAIQTATKADTVKVQAAEAARATAEVQQMQKLMRTQVMINNAVMMSNLITMFSATL